MTLAGEPVPELEIPPAERLRLDIESYAIELEMAERFAAMTEELSEGVQAMLDDMRELTVAAPEPKEQIEVAALTLQIAALHKHVARMARAAGGKLAGIQDRGAPQPQPPPDASAP